MWIYLHILTVLASATYNNSTARCDIILDGGVCLYAGETVIMPNSRQNGLVGHWTFDDNQVLDYSGLAQHGLEAVEAGPAPGGQGHSSKFSGSEYIEIPTTEEMNDKIFSVTMWMYLLRDSEVESHTSSGLRYCPILQKGIDDSSNKSYRRTPAIFLDRKDKCLKVYVTTTETVDYPMGEYVESNARIPYQRWTHVGVVRTEKRIRLYVNGIIDAVNATEGWTTINTDPLYLGKTPWHQTDCKVPLYIDDVKFFKRELYEEEMEAEAFGALGHIEAHYIRLGCINCELSEANTSCPDGYHLCTSIELHSGGYAVARANGWTSWNSHLWAYGTNEKDYEGQLGLGICCLDLT